MRHPLYCTFVAAALLLTSAVAWSEEVVGSHAKRPKPKKPSH